MLRNPTVIRIALIKQAAPMGGDCHEEWQMLSGYVSLCPEHA